MRGKHPSITLPPSTPGPSSVKMEFARTHSPISHDFGFPPSSLSSSQKNNLMGNNGQEMNRNGGSAPDYFTSSEGTTSSSEAPSRSSSTSSDHPWANLFPEGAAGAATSMPRSDQGFNASIGSVSMSSSSSSSESFKMPKTVQRMRSGASNASTSTNTSVLTADDLAKFHPIEPLELAQSLATAPSTSKNTAESTLIIDIRPSTSYALARIQGSINLCAPSTLLKRAGVTVDRIEEEMLSNEQDQTRFSGWKCGPQKNGMKRGEISNGVTPINRIVVLDTDTISAGEAGKPSSGGGGPCLIGVLRKFDLAGYAGQLLWLVGGFNSFSSQISNGSKNGQIPSELASLLDSSELSGQKTTTSSAKGIIPSLQRTESNRRSSAPVGKNGGMFDVRPDNTTRKPSLVQPRGLPMEAFSLTSTTRRSSIGEGRRSMQLSASHPTLDIDGKRAPGDAAPSACANPFFDNIRQNHELHHGITEKIPLELPAMSRSELDGLPLFLRQLAEMNQSNRAETLAKKFFDIEKAEQRRLIATMQQHAAESNLHGNAKDVNAATEKLQSMPSGTRDALNLSSAFCSVKAGQNCDNTSKETFPFSIAAALERGSENRYNNIWTYEHSRVRCQNPSEYLNGSYVEPAREFGCERRYIATQAPLPSTFNTFWAVVWQQNVRAICMVTREFESGRVQSHNYWKEERYGDIALKVVEETSLDAEGRMMKSLPKEGEKKEGDYMFPSMGNSASDDDQPYTIKRRFLLSRGSETKEVIQFHFVAWPDFSVPDNCQGILNYMRLANQEQHKVELEEKKQTSNRIDVGPLLVHCSAGVGRTGTYIAIDSVLDVLRRRRRTARGLKAASVWDDNWGDAEADGVREDVAMSSPAGATTTLLPSLQPILAPVRKSLKRELSPSAMDIDTNEGERRSSQGTISSFHNHSTARQMHGGVSSSSPPPLQRSRSDEVDEQGQSSFSLDSFTFATSPPSSSGLETPSGAMGSMKIAWDSPHQTPTKLRSVKPSSNLNSTAQEEDTLPVGKTSTTPAPMALDVSKSSKEDEEIDLIERVVETIREQRMSTVQTGRQYVFAYQAVIEGILSEEKMERGRR